MVPGLDIVVDGKQHFVHVQYDGGDITHGAHSRNKRFINKTGVLNFYDK